MAASLTFSRLLSSTAATTTALSLSSTAATTSLFPPKTLSSTVSSKFSLTPLSLNFHAHHHNRPGSLKFSTTTTTKSTISATISVGDKLPESTFSYFDPAGELQTTTVSDLTKGKKAIFFAVPGAFTPTCSQKHLPGFVEKSAELKSKGVDTIACISVNDAFVIRAWKENLKVNDEVLLLSDGNGNFTRAIGSELDLSDNPAGLGVRSRRYALLAEDGVVKVLNLEEGGAFTFSGAEDILKLL
ncbi:putative Peroxiredoxin [Quillaja saponaria]|uniref:Glutaredoxin-dependent peroxiredoxin n=1 Tax=Quillaja saponaria TaxID=32244 RepID=A0AAD7PYG0_QUISA|nr:putative Peroxiredoxin [Quillaja saponaria]